MPDRSQKIPDQKELEKELSDYLSKKYGAHIKVISPMMMPQTAGSDKSDEPTHGVSEIKFDMKPTALQA